MKDIQKSRKQQVIAFCRTERKYREKRKVETRIEELD